MWVLFQVPCPTPDGRSAKDLYERRIPWITPEMQASAREHGCRFHRAWYAEDGSAFYAIANWESREGARVLRGMGDRRRAGRGPDSPGG